MLGGVYVLSQAVDLHREEVRGIFVIGVLAAILGVLNLPESSRTIAPTEFFIAMQVLMLYWGLYAFFMAVGVSSDIIGAPVPAAAVWIGHGLFSYSILATIAIFATTMLNIGPIRIVFLRPTGLAVLGLLWVMYLMSGLVGLIRYLLKTPRQPPRIIRALASLLVFILFSIPLLFVP